jgi:hypothetical protein
MPMTSMPDSDPKGVCLPDARSKGQDRRSFFSTVNQYVTNSVLNREVMSFGEFGP